MIYFNSNTQEIVSKEDAFNGEELKTGIFEYPDGAEYLLPTNDNLEIKWAMQEKIRISEEIEELLDSDGDPLDIQKLRQYRQGLRDHKKNKGKKENRPVRPI